MSEGLDKLAQGVGKAIEKVPDLYDDAFKSVAQESGEVLALVPRAIKAALLPLRNWIVQREYNHTETLKLLAIKMEHTNPSKIVTPDAYVAVPLLQAISYSANCETLRELYATLLKNAMISDTKDLVHPSFVETIKQLSPEDAVFFKQICPLRYRPIIDISISFPNGGYRKIAKYCNTLTTVPPSNSGLTIDNLMRLGLIDIPLDEYYSKEYVYDSLLTTLESKYNLELYKSDYPQAIGLKYQKRRINITTYGQSFYNICVL